MYILCYLVRSIHIGTNTLLWLSFVIINCTNQVIYRVDKILDKVKNYKI